jgi:predicted membrane-bound spermidine synthase
MNPYLYFVVFISGMTSLAIEMLASRLLGPDFGTSNLVWASIIGLILIYLTLGYFLGGHWADRSPYPRTMYTVLAWAAFTAGLPPLIARPVLWAAANAFDQLDIGVWAGSFAAVLVLFCIPVTLMGTASPFAIRIAITNPSQAGQISGRIYAISTLGSFVGTFLPTLVLIPTIGTTLSFLFFAILLNLVALLGVWKSAGWRAFLPWIWMPVILVALGLVWGHGPTKKTPEQIYETESAYNYIQVLDRDGYILLRLNEGQGIHSIYNPDTLEYGGPWQQFLVAPFFNEAPYDPGHVQSMAIVGLAGGTVARQATAVFGPIPIDGFEIDPKIIKVGQEYFDMNLPNLTAIAQDGRYGLTHSGNTYSVIVVDAYRPPYIPWHLTTREFFQMAYNHLTSDGVIAINVGRSTSDRRLVDGMVGTLRSVFPSVYVMDVPYSFNTIVYATLQPTRLENLYANYEYLQTAGVHPLLWAAVDITILNMQPTPDSHTVYTDDLAPIELITNQLVLDFVLTGGVEGLK